MEARAAIPPGLPHPDPTRSYWQTPPASTSNHRTTASLPSEASVVVIGSGITGATVAYNLLSSANPPRSVLLLEARTACSGATGRNGGHTKAASYRSFLHNLDSLGASEAIKIAELEYNCQRATHAFARQHGIACDSWEGQTSDIVYDRGNWALAKQAIAAMRRELPDSDNNPVGRYEFCDDPDETERRFFTPGALGAVTYEAGSINGYKFVIGVLELALGLGLNLQTETPVTGAAPGR